MPDASHSWVALLTSLQIHKEKSCLSARVRTSFRHHPSTESVRLVEIALPRYHVLRRKPLRNVAPSQGNMQKLVLDTQVFVHRRPIFFLFVALPSSTDAHSTVGVPEKR